MIGKPEEDWLPKKLPRYPNNGGQFILGIEACRWQKWDGWHACGPCGEMKKIGDAFPIQLPKKVTEEITLPIILFRIGKD